LFPAIRIGEKVPEIQCGVSSVKKVIGVDLGGTNIVTAVVDSHGKVLGRDKRPTQISLGAHRVIARIADSARTAVEGCGLSLSDIAAVGVGSPGPLNPKTGVILNWVNGGWKNISLGAELKKNLKKKVFIENDANVAALGEAWVGAGRGRNVVLCLTLGTGVGGGLILDGKIYAGAWDVGCEIGHIVVNPDGPKTSYGNSGILEQYCSATGIVRMAKEKGLVSPDDQPLQAHQVQQMALQGNGKARQVYRDAGRFLGVGLTSAIHLFNPSTVIFSGGVSGAGNLLFQPMHEELKMRCFPQSLKGIRFHIAKLGDNMGVVGAARLAYQQL
jgi:glucokinase